MGKFLLRYFDRPRVLAVQTVDPQENRVWKITPKGCDIEGRCGVCVSFTWGIFTIFFFKVSRLTFTFSPLKTVRHGAPLGMCECMPLN